MMTAPKLSQSLSTAEKEIPKIGPEELDYAAEVSVENGTCALRRLVLVAKKVRCVCACVCLCVCVCVCVCVWGAKDQKEFGMSVRKEKIKRVRGICRRQ